MNLINLILKSRKAAVRSGELLKEIAMIYNRMAATPTRSEQVSCVRA
jgi:hypothetical protein